MVRRKEGARILGPYEHNGSWRIIEVAGDGSRSRCHFETEGKALAYKKLLEQQLRENQHSTESALDEYLIWLETRKGNKEGSRKRTEWAVKKLFPEPLSLAGLKAKSCQAAYDRVVDTGIAVDSHRNALAETKTFLTWCVEQGWLGANPMLGVKGVGRRSKGKAQLRIKDARAWYDKAVELAEAGNDGAIAALMALLLGLRSSEITGIKIRDLDEDEQPCDVLHVADAKTVKGIRAVDVPEPLRTFLEGLAGDRDRGAWLFPSRSGGRHWRDWPSAQVKRICSEAKVDKISAHGMRGTLATIALERGAAGRLVADTLGHEEVRTTRESYAKRGAGEKAERAKGRAVLVRKRTQRKVRGE